MSRSREAPQSPRERGELAPAALSARSARMDHDSPPVHVPATLASVVALAAWVDALLRASIVNRRPLVCVSNADQ